MVVDEELYVLTSETGRSDSPVTFLRYNPVEDVWTKLPLPGVARGGVTLVGGDHAVLAVANPGRGAPVVDMVFEKTRQQWRRLPRDPFDVGANRSAAWFDGRLLLAESPSPPDPSGDMLRLATLDLTSTMWTALPPVAVGGGTLVVVEGRVIYPFFQSTGKRVGRNDQLHPNAALLDLSEGTWQMLPGRPGGQGLGTDVVTAGDRVLMGGHLGNPRTQAWLQVPPPPWSDRWYETVLASSSSIFVYGGTSNNNSDPRNLVDAYLLRIPPG